MIGMKGNNKLKKKDYIRLLYFFGGLTIFSLSFTFFLLPNNLVFGGVSGLSIIFKELFNFNTSLFVLIVSVLLLILSYFVLGKEKTTGSVMGSLLLPLFLEIMRVISDLIKYENNDLLICAIFGGVFAGLGLGLVYKAGFTTGGTDIINQIIHKIFKLSIGKAMFITDGLIVTSSIFVFGFTRSLYAIMVLYIITVMTDRVILGVSKSKAFYKVTDKTEEVKSFIIKELGHSITMFDAIGGFKGKDKKVIFCVIPTREYFKLKEGINKIDSESFFVVTDSYEVVGGE